MTGGIDSGDHAGAAELARVKTVEGKTEIDNNIHTNQHTYQHCQTDRPLALVLYDHAMLTATLNLLPIRPMRDMLSSRTKDTQDVDSTTVRGRE